MFAFSANIPLRNDPRSRFSLRSSQLRETCATTTVPRRRLLMATELDAPAALLTLKKRRVLYPPIKPYYTDNVKVSDIHTIYYEISGNPRGLPVIFVHGGPGGATGESHRRFFDPQVYKIILFDQRGCGKSTPTACLEENTTWALVDDMETIREACRVDKWVVFGGSWGSTLSVAYAQCHAHRVVALILRGIFMIRKQEVEWLYERNGAAMLYPEAFEKYLRGLPEEMRQAPNLMRAYHKVLSSNVESEERRKAAHAWSGWEHALSCFPRSGEEEEESPMSEYNEEENLAFARIESHYFFNEGFLEEDGFLLSEKQMKKIRHIKAYIVQGRWDMVCPRKTAFELGAMFKGNAETVIVDDAGHSTFEAGIGWELLRATDAVGKEFGTNS